MRRKLVVLTLLLAATVSAAGAKPRTGPRIIRMKNTCLSCASCGVTHCYDCYVIACPDGSGGPT
jgi:hypothetical protein